MFAQPRILSEQASVEIGAESQDARRGGVQRPHLAGSMLYADRSLRNDRVQRAAVQRPGDGFVIADAADPFAAGGARKRGDKRFAINNFRRAAFHGTARGGEGEQVNVVIMESGKQRPSPRFDDFLAARGKPGADLDHAAVATAHVGAA